jgi:hypothetical protein
MIVPVLLGAVILTDATQVSSRARTESSSPLVLTGTIAYTDPRQGFAIIGSSVRNTFLARPGQQLPDGSRIREIHPKHVVLEHGDSLETVGMYDRGQQSAGAVYAQIPLSPQQTRSEDEELKGITAHETGPSLARPTADVPPGHPRPSDTRPNETPANEMRLNDTPPSDALPKRVQPEVPLPTTAQDPVDEFNDYRRQRAENLRK